MYLYFSLCLNYGGRFPCKSIQLFRSLSEGKRTFPHSVSYGVIIYLTGRLVWKVFHDFQRKKEGIKHFTDNLEFKEGWSTVKFPSLSYEAPAVLPHFSINGLERVNLMIIKGEQFFILSKRIWIHSSWFSHYESELYSISGMCIITHAASTIDKLSFQKNCQLSWTE